MATEVTLATEQKELERPKPDTPAPRPKGARRRPQHAGRSRKAARTRRWYHDRSPFVEPRGQPD
ncbi:hypothetical protein CWO90_37615 [Bradyrhizobium sp. Leo121]|nr:hypothetical protein CWO90_37615 [Bradyrhizobium sp. Leo121]